MSLQSNQTTTSSLRQVFDQIAACNPRMTLPAELQNNIISKVMDTSTAWTSVPSRQPSRSPAFTPPANGACPILEVPTELRRRFFAEALPARDAIHRPSCKDDPPRRPVNDWLLLDTTPRRNAVSDLLRLNKKISLEITEILYEERFFAIHVHEGLRDGGIEFLDAGRQPLQYKDCIHDPRFERFGENDKFGFRSLKKIIVQIYPTTEDHGRHVAMNTYFVNLALCRLLERSGEKRHRITSLKIEFPQTKSKSPTEAVGRAAIQHADQYWWDADQQRPRETSIHGVSNIELVLRPFGNLTSCHSVNIELPGYLRNDQATVDFVTRLEKSMQSKHGTLTANDHLEKNIECARAALEEYVIYTIHGKGFHDIPKLTEEDFAADHMEEDSPTTPTNRKHTLSPSNLDGGDWKRKPGQSRKEWLEQPFQKWGDLALEEEEQRLIHAAIANSLKGRTNGQYLDGPSQIQPIQAPLPLRLRGLRKNFMDRLQPQSNGDDGDPASLTAPRKVISAEENRLGNLSMPFSGIDASPGEHSRTKNDLSLSSMNGAGSVPQHSVNGASPGSALHSNTMAIDADNTSSGRSPFLLNPPAHGLARTAAGPNESTGPAPPVLPPGSSTRTGRTEIIDLIGDSRSEQGTATGSSPRRTASSMLLRLSNLGSSDTAKQPGDTTNKQPHEKKQQ